MVTQTPFWQLPVQNVPARVTLSSTWCCLIRDLRPSRTKWEPLTWQALPRHTVMVILKPSLTYYYADSLPSASASSFLLRK